MKMSLFCSLFAFAAGFGTAFSAIVPATTGGSDAERIIAAIEKACQDGSRKVKIPQQNADRATWTIDRTIDLPENFTLLLDGAHLVLGKGTFINMFRADGVSGVRIVGRNGATADGGEYNGLSERNAEKDGRPPIWVNNTLLFSNVTDFRVEGIRFANQRWWALNFVGCSKGVIRNIDFLAHHTSRRPDGTVVDTLSQEAYEAVCVKNADGIDLRAGCHDILVENITGFTEDDSVALTCMPWRFERQLLKPGTPYEISDVTVRNVKTAAYCSNVRILAGGGGRIRRVLVDGVTDTSDGKTYIAGRGARGVNIGDRHIYAGSQCDPGDMDDITVRNVRSRAHYGVSVRGPVGNVKIENVVGFDGCPNPICDQRETAGPQVSVFASQVVEHARRTGLSVKAAAEAFRAAGIGGFDCHYGDADVPELVKGGLVPVNFYGDVKFLSPDGGAKQAEAFIAAALQHKVPRVMVLPDEFTGADDEADFAKIVDGLKMFVRRATAKGLVVTTEDYGYFRTHQNPCGHVAFIRRLLESVPELMFTVDSGNLHVLEGRDAVLEITRFAADRIRHVHLKDCAASAVPGKRGPYVTLGTGEIPNREIVRFVRNLGYLGWYTLENLTGADLLDDAVRQVATVRRWTTTPAEPKWTRVVKFDKPDKTPLVYGGWSRSIDAAADEYCIYLDIYYDNGTLVYGPRVSWRLGTHGWEEAKGVFLPQRPVKEVRAHAFLRKGTGWAEFRDVYVERRSPRKGEVFHPCSQSDIPHSNAEERLWDTLEGARLVPHESRTMNAVPANSPIADGKTVVWTADSRRTVTPLTFPGKSDGATAAIELAGRERESFQICISTAADVEWKDGSLVVPELKTKDGRRLKGRVEWQRIGYIPRRPGYFNHWSPHAPPSREKWIPDPLLPAAPYRVRPASTQGLWVTVAADSDADPGEYSGELAVAEGGAVRGTVKLTARVRGFALPKTFGLRTAFALMDGVLRRQYGADRLRKMKTEAIDILLDHRLNPDDISRFKLPEMPDLLHARDRGMNSFNLLNVVPEPKNKNAVCVLYSTPEETGTDAFYESFKRRLTPFVAEIRKNGLVKHAYVYGFDEREQNYFPGIDAFWQKFRKDFPDIPLMTTAKMYQYLADGKTNVEHLVTTDWYCPVTHRYNKETSDRLRTAGKQVWWYTCCTPLPPYANMAGVDWPAADGRILLGNMTWLYRADGFLFWHVNNWKPTSPLLSEDDTYFPEWRALEVPVSWSITGCAGDGVFLYPGKERIFSSIRLALIRDGVEDYEWLQAAAAKRGCDAADSAIRATVASLTEFERDVEKLRAARSRVGDLAER